MGLLQRFESRLEDAVSGAFARAFRSAVQPVELAAALQREVDNNAQILSRQRRLAPNQFSIELSAVDHERLEPYAETLAVELGDLLKEHVREQGYVFAGPVSIEFSEEPDLSTGRFRVLSKARSEVSRSPTAPVASSQQPASASSAASEPARAASLLVHGEPHHITAPGLTIGRGSDAGLRIDDPGISRNHARFTFEASSGRLEVTDLGSTNGTAVNGRKVSETRLRDGDVIKVGTTELIVHITGSES